MFLISSFFPTIFFFNFYICCSDHIFVFLKLTLNYYRMRGFVLLRDKYQTVSSYHKNKTPCQMWHNITSIFLRTQGTYDVLYFSKIIYLQPTTSMSLHRIY